VLDDGADIERDDLRKSAGTFLEKLTSMSSQLSPCAGDVEVVPGLVELEVAVPRLTPAMR